MKLYDTEFKDELKVTKAEAKHILYCYFFNDTFGICTKKQYLEIYQNLFKTGAIYESVNNDLTYRDEYKNYKWVLTNKFKQGDVVKPVDYNIDKDIYVFDKNNRFGLTWCWCIYKNRPKEVMRDKWMYKLVERE